jgi:hypothetical protein
MELRNNKKIFPAFVLITVRTQVHIWDPELLDPYKKEDFGIRSSKKSRKKSCIAAGGEEGEKGVPAEP